jgi:HAMP domain-containing protein
MMRTLLGLVSRLSVTAKLVTIYILDLLVTASVLVSFVSDKDTQINFNRSELEGLAIYEPARLLYQDLLQDALADRPPADFAAVLDQRLAVLDTARRDHGAGMGLDAPWSKLAASAAAYDKARLGPQREAAFLDYQDRLWEFLSPVGDKSNLILDPSVDSDYVMAVIVINMRGSLAAIEKFRVVALNDPPGAAREAQLSQIMGDIRRSQATIDSGLQASMEANEDGTLRAHILGTMQQFDAVIDALSATSDGSNVRDAASNAIATSFNFWIVLNGELTRMIKLRIADLYHQMALQLGVTLVLAMAVLGAVTIIGLQIARPVRELASVAASFRSGDPRRARWRSRDEFGQLVAAFNGMLDRLADESQQREDLAATARAAEAQRNVMEGIGLPVIIVSLDGTVLQSNAAAQGLLGDESIKRLLEFVEKMRRDDPALMEKFMQTGALDGFEIELGGNQGWMLLSARKVEYRGETVALFSLTPITQLKEIEAALRDAKEAAEVTSDRLRATTEAVMASINYASRIQHSIFPDPAELSRLANGIEIWVEQRDIVGGDWYAVSHFDEGDLIFLCDCTGHGVPGALMTMLVSACFRRAVEGEGYRAPAAILRSLHRQVRAAMSRATGDLAADDGLDAVCLFIERAPHVARVASARLALFHAGRNGLSEIKGSRSSIGYPSLPEEVSIDERTIPVETGDLFYLFTDGCTDHVSGSTGLLFGRRRLYDAVAALTDLPPSDQILRLRGVLADYRGMEPLRDDASLIIVRVDEPA